MRPIEFRAWHIREKRMFTPCNITFNQITGKQTGVTEERGDDKYHHYGAKLVVTNQYTGLKDKKGIKIFEGDIVDAWSAGSNANCEVRWGKGCVGFFLYHKWGPLKWSLSGGGENYDQESVEVIGNIYENPELLDNK